MPVGNPDGEWGGLDPTVPAPDGTPSFFVMPPGYVPFNAECDGVWQNLTPGDHVILQAWVKTDAWTGSTDIHCGSFFAWDFYAQGYINGVLYSGIAMLDDYSGNVQMGHPSQAVPYPDEFGYDGYNYGYTIDGSSGLHQVSGNICRVPYNVLEWKFCRWEFWVPTRTFRRILTTVNGVQDIYVLDSPGVIHGMIPWLGALDMYLRGHKVWFGQTEMYINPTESHLPTPPPTDENLAPTDLTTLISGYNSSYASFDPTTKFNNNAGSIKLGPDYTFGTREVDILWADVAPNDLILCAAWVRTDALSQSADNQPGIRLGLDTYIESYITTVVDPVNNPDAPPINAVDSGVSRPNVGHPNEQESANGMTPDANGVSWGSLGANPFRLDWGHGWTLLYWLVTIPDTTFTQIEHSVNGRSYDYYCDPAQISKVAMIIDVREQRDPAFAYFTSPLYFYRNPSQATIDAIINGNVPKPTPEECHDQATCEANGYYWYDGACHLNPKPTEAFTFGRQDAGNITDYSLGGNSKNATRFLCSNTGLLSKITANVFATSGSATVRCAIYTDNMGSPDALIAQTNDVVIGGNLSWVDFGFTTPPAVEAGTYYWLAIISADGLAITWQNDMGQSEWNYSNGFSNPWGLHDAYTGELSIYATSQAVEPTTFILTINSTPQGVSITVSEVN